MVYYDICAVLKSFSKPGNNNIITNVQLNVLVTAIITAIS